MAELKPCPFCAGIEIMTFSRSGRKGAFAWVECDTCGAKTRCVSTNTHADEPDFRGSIAEEHLISLWNRRVGERQHE